MICDEPDDLDEYEPCLCCADDFPAGVLEQGYCPLCCDTEEEDED